MLDTAFSPWPSFSAEEIDAVTALLRSGRVNYWTGEECREFEKEFAAWCGTKHAVSLTNGTVALDLALKVLGIGAGDEVVVTPRTFLASASSVVNAGARPVFADVDRESQNVTAETIRPVLSARTRAILCVHIAGWPCEMDGISALANERGLHVIEDAAQAHGARYRGRPVGSLGTVAAWSFCQDKIVTTGGEGGMLTTDDAELWHKAWSYKDHGKSWDAMYNRQHAPGFRWVHEMFGTNWRMMEMQAAIGRIQLKRMAEWNAARRRNAETILAADAELLLEAQLAARLLADHVDRTARGVAAVQGALRTAQNFDALQIEERHGQRPAAVQIFTVDVGGYRCVPAVGEVTDTADGHAHRALILGHDRARCDLAEVVGVAEPGARQLLGREHADRDRHVLDILRAHLRSDDHFLERPLVLGTCCQRNCARNEPEGSG